MKLWKVDWQIWLEEGCNKVRLNTLLISEAIEPAKSTVQYCMNNGAWSASEKADFLVKQALNIAEQDTSFDQINNKLQQAYELDPINLQQFSVG